MWESAVTGSVYRCSAESLGRGAGGGGRGPRPGPWPRQRGEPGGRRRQHKRLTGQAQGERGKPGQCDISEAKRGSRRKGKSAVLSDAVRLGKMETPMMPPRPTMWRHLVTRGASRFTYREIEAQREEVTGSSPSGPPCQGPSPCPGVPHPPHCHRSPECMFLCSVILDAPAAPWKKQDESLVPTWQMGKPRQDGVFLPRVSQSAEGGSVLIISQSSVWGTQK